MSTSSENIRTVLQAQAQEHGVKLSLDEGAAPPQEAVLDAVHHALHGVALARLHVQQCVAVDPSEPPGHVGSTGPAKPPGPAQCAFPGAR
jgi:hypothetical protein